MRPFGDCPRQELHQAQIAPGVFIRLNLAHHRFTEHVHREGAALLMKPAQGGGDLLVVIAQHELPRHAGDLRLDARAEQPRRPARCFQTQLQRRGELKVLFAQILLQVPRNLGGRGERRQHVHEAEELRLEMLIAHRPIHQRAVKALFGEQGRRLGGIHEAEQLLAIVMDGGLHVPHPGRAFSLCDSSWSHRGHESLSPTTARQTRLRDERDAGWS